MKFNSRESESASTVSAVTEQSRCHTPGPWNIQLPRKIGGYTAAGDLVKIRSPEEPDWAVALVSPGSPDAEGNARLIAAAPDMLAALRALVLIDGHTTNIEIRNRHNAALAAIAKAEGE
jgi:hypothetical protein